MYVRMYVYINVYTYIYIYYCRVFPRVIYFIKCRNFMTSDTKSNNVHHSPPSLSVRTTWENYLWALQQTVTALDYPLITLSG